MASTTDADRSDLEERLERLEAVVDRQQELLEEQRTIIDGLLADDGGGSAGLSRRSLLKAAGAVGLAGYATGQAAADPMGQLGTSEDPLRILHTEKLGSGLVAGNEVSSLLGEGLDVEENTLSAAGAAADHADVAESGDTVLEDVETLNFNANLSVDEGDDGAVEIDSSDSTGSDTHTDVSDGGSTVVSDTDDIDFGSNLSVTDDGDGTISVSGTSGGQWEDSNSSNDLLEPISGSKGIEVDQLGSDPDISDDKGALYASDGNATGSAGDVVVGADDGGSDARAVLFEHANAGIPGGSITDGSVDVAQLNTDFTDLATLFGTPISTGGNINAGGNAITNLNNLALNDATGDGIPAQAIEHGKVWADDGQVYDSVQNAENASSSLVVVGRGTFKEQVTVDTSELVIIGMGRGTVIDAGSTATTAALDVTGDDVVLKNLAAKTTGGGGSSANAIDTTDANDAQILDCWILDSDDTGIKTGPRTLVRGCRIQAADTFGIRVFDGDARIMNNFIDGTGDNAIKVDGNDSIIAGNQELGGKNLNVDGEDCVISHNRISGTVDTGDTSNVQTSGNLQGPRN